MSTNNLGIKRSIHEAVSGFDETIRMVEDVDYCWRVQRTGVELKEEQSTRVQIRFRPNLKSICIREYYQGVYEILLYKKISRLACLKWCSGRHGLKHQSNFYCMCCYLRYAIA
jgi:hypothetical protein